MLGFYFFLTLLAVIVIPYLLGGIPFGFLIARGKNKDLLKAGSGNIGATNVTRAISGKMGILTLLLDFAKGYFAVVISVAFFHLLIAYNTFFFSHLFTLAYLSMFFVVLGHIFSPYLKFKGGKGVATSGGCILALSPSLFLVVAVAIIIVVGIYKIVSLASLITAGAAGIFCFIPWLNYYYLQLMNASYHYFANIEALITITYFNVLATSIIMLCVAILVIVKHKGNISRLLLKKERIFQVGKDDLTQQNYVKNKKKTSNCFDNHWFYNRVTFLRTSDFSFKTITLATVKDAFAWKSIVIKSGIFLSLCAILIPISLHLQAWALSLTPKQVFASANSSGLINVKPIGNPGIEYSALATSAVWVVYFIESITIILASLCLIFVEPAWYYLIPLSFCLIGGVMNTDSRCSVHTLVAGSYYALMHYETHSASYSIHNVVIDYWHFHNGNSIFNFNDTLVISGATGFILALLVTNIVVFYPSLKQEFTKKKYDQKQSSIMRFK